MRNLHLRSHLDVMYEDEIHDGAILVSKLCMTRVRRANLGRNIFLARGMLE